VIVTFDELKNYRGAVAMVDGAFDPLHRGHIEYFRAASALSVPLLCNIASDRYVRSKHVPLLPEDQRAAVVDAIRYISYTHINQFDTETILSELRPRYYVKGSDWGGRLPAEQVAICAPARHRDRVFGHRARFVEPASFSSSPRSSDITHDHHRIRGRRLRAEAYGATAL
jgi:cytidyltransferase-like protein